jgi:tryptophan synthase alpha chain
MHLSSTGATTELEQFITQQRQQQSLLLMSHAVLGYPSFQDNRILIDTLVQSGVQLIELQFPFSEPIADGPVLLGANQAAIQAGTTVDQCFRFAADVASAYQQTRFVLMTYCNILFKYGIQAFVETSARSGIAGLIVPDLPPQVATDYIQACRQSGLATIFLVTPTTRPERLQQIANVTTGMVYCVARKGVTGYHTHFSAEFDHYLQQIRAATTLPIAVGFGVQSKQDIAHLKEQADVAIVCTQAIKLYIEQGSSALKRFINDLQPAHSAFCANNR